MSSRYRVESVSLKNIQERHDVLKGVSPLVLVPKSLFPASRDPPMLVLGLLGGIVRNGWTAEPPQQ